MFNIEVNYNESKWGVNSEELFNSPEERADLAHYEIVSCIVKNNSIDKILDKTIVETIDLALVQLDRYSDYGTSEEVNHHVIIMQGKKKPTMIKHWFSK
jgi:hypothetical protein